MEYILSSFSTPVWKRAGQELMLLAQKFSETEERRRVQCMAETVDMSSINMENFFKLCAELFYVSVIFYLF